MTKKWVLASAFIAAPLPVAAQMPSMPMPATPPPKEMAMPVPKPAENAQPSAAITPAPIPKPQPDWPRPIDDAAPNSVIVVDLLEYQLAKSGDQIRWDSYGWYGGDRNRFWYKTEGVKGIGSRDGEQELQLLFGHLVAPFFDLQAGGRVATRQANGARTTRTYASVGLQGVAPYLFEIEPVLFLSDRGKISGRFNVSYELLVTQKLVLQPRLDTEFAFQADRAFAVGAGLGSIETGLRLRYEVRREFAPYIGVSYRRSFGETRRLLALEGEPTKRFTVVAGVRLWF